MDFDDDSDLTSLEDEDERGVDDAATRDFQSLRPESDSSLSSETDDMAETGHSNCQDNSVPSVKLSPSRIGSSLTRPAPVAGLRTYGRRRERSSMSLKQPRTPKSSPPPELEGYESPLTPLSSPSPRKRRTSASTQQTLSSPSKRARKRNGLASDAVPKPVKKPASSRKVKMNGHDSVPASPSPSTKRKENGKVLQSKAPASSVSVGQRRPVSSSPEPKARNTKSLKARTWSLETLDTLVWVRVGRNNAVVNDDRDESFWWPAMMDPAIDRWKAVQIQLLFPPSGASTSLLITVKKPSFSNIVSYKDHPYTTNSFWALPASSAQSRPAGFDELKFRWESAYKRIVEEDLRLHDGFPTSLTALLSQPLGNKDNAENESVSRAVSPAPLAAPPSMSLEDELWEPPLPDPSIMIPGEHILCTTKQFKKRCWGKFYPAKVIAYVPPSNPVVPPKYTVHFMDNFHEDVTRDMFYIYEQEEFGTCKLGAFESLESLDEKDGDDELAEVISAESTDRIVFSGPPPLPPPPPDQFCRLTMLEQASYIIPILTKVIENNYKPAGHRISAFLGGGRERREMSKQAPAKGLLTRSEFNELARIVRCWALGIDSSTDEMRDVNIPHENDTYRITEQVAPHRPERTDAPQEAVSSPDDLLVKETTNEVSDREPIPSLPPSSLPPSSLTDESPSSTPNGVGGDDRDVNRAASGGETKLVLDDQRPTNGVHATTTRQPTPSTSRSFKDLLNHEKIHFCTDVLLKEAVIQLLLWRAGKRRSPELLSETEELLLHESGSNLAGEFDIARMVRDLRMKKEKYLQARTSSKQQISTGGTRSRPRKV